MYTAHFGLDDGPFRGNAAGRDVYAGPRQTAVVGRLRNALASPDTVIAVTGPVGVGKTTLVGRAIRGVAGKKIVVPVDRMRLAPDEVLDLLLVRFDVSRQPKGTVQRVAAFRRLLSERLAGETRVFIVVEDAQRIGIDALLEIEALTATDGGDAGSANIVLIGSEALPALLADPSLARLRQRMRLRQEVPPFDANDVEAYMRHCLDAAGGAFEQIFERGAAEVVYRYSAGVARVIDNLCDAALIAAADAGVATILPEFLQEVAESCGLEPLATEAPPTADAAVGQVPTAEAEPPANADIAVADEDAGSPALPASDLPAAAPAEPPSRMAIASLADLPAESMTPLPGELSAGAPPPAGMRACEPPVKWPDEGAANAGELAQAAPPAAGATQDTTLPGESLVSRIDEVLPGLLERLQVSAAAGVPSVAPSAGTAPQPGADAEADGTESDGADIEDTRSEMCIAEALVEPAANAENADDIPTLSNSMRVTALPAVLAEAAVPATGRADTDSSEADDDAPAAVVTEGDFSPVDATPGTEHAAGEAPPAEAGLLPTAATPDAESSPVEADAETGAATEAFADAGLHDAPLETQAVAESAEPAPEHGAVEESAVDLQLIADDADVHSAAVTGAAAEVQLADEPLGPAAEAPELDALQAAIQAANAWQAGEATHADDSAPAPTPAEEPMAPEAAHEAPEIALGDDAPSLADGGKSAGDLDRFADELSKAHSLEDISDMLAETLFGSEALEGISAEIRANKAAEADAVAGNEPTGASPPPSAPQKPGNGSTNAPFPARAAKPPPPASAPRAEPPAAGSLTMSQRIDMVNSLNKGRPAMRLPASGITEIVLGDAPDRPAAAQGKAPAPIEAQIDTAITQSRKALSEADLARLVAEDDDEAPRRLFGLFRRSSKR